MQRLRVMPPTEVDETSLIEGAVVSGLIGAAAVAAWFALVNALAGVHLLTTPATLGTALFRGPDALAGGAEFSVLTVLGYSIVHVLAFIGLGAVFSAVARQLRQDPSRLSLIVAAFVAVEVAALAALAAMDPIWLSGSGMVAVGVANLVGPLAMAAWYWRRDPALHLGYSLDLSDGEGDSPVHWGAEGVIAGLVGATTVAVWFLVVNLLTGQHLFTTPALLGTVIFHGLPALEAGGPVVDLRTVGGYSLIHFGGFAVVGYGLAAVFRRIRRAPPLSALAVLLFAMFQAMFFSLLVALGADVLGVLGSVSVGVANLLAVGSICGMLWLRHPGLRQQVRMGWDELEGRPSA